MMSAPRIYHYHPETCAYLGSDIPDESPLEPGVYLIPSFATRVPPTIQEDSVSESQYVRWNASEERWVTASKPVPNTLDTVEEEEPIGEPQDPMRLLREERNRRLTEVDWRISRASSGGPALSDEWLAYLKALRDLPSISTPTLTEANQLDMDSIEWPIAPEY